MFKRFALKAVVALAIGLATGGWLFADDDDDDDHHEGHGWSRTSRAAEYRQLAPLDRTAPAAAKWANECAGCHMLYHPGLLPERSWKKMMTGLEDHFGENASLEPKVREEVTSFLARNAADRVPSRRSGKIAASISPGQAPLRISETAYFIRKHDEIRPSVYKRPKIGSPANCVACHSGAERGNFSEHEVKIPRE